MDSKYAPKPLIRAVAAVTVLTWSAMSWAPNPNPKTASRLERANEIKAGTRPAVVSRFESEKHRVALTFDDGPQPELTQNILAILKKFNVQATFFMIGAKVAVEPEIARAVAAAGHEVANHTYMHRNLTTMDAAKISIEFDSTSSIIESKVGVSPVLCRPPGGNYNQAVVDAATDQGMTTVLWTTNPGDCNQLSAEAIAKSVLECIKPGGIILLHDTVPATAEALPIILKGLKKRGLKPVQVSQLINSPR